MKKITTSLILSALLLSGCATLFTKKTPDPIIVTVTETTYVTVPEELNNCPEPVILSAAEILEITSAQENEDVDSEDLYNKYFVKPLYERHETCWKSSKEIERWNQTVEESNKKEDDNEKP